MIDLHWKTQRGVRECVADWQLIRSPQMAFKGNRKFSFFFLEIQKHNYYRCCLLLLRGRNEEMLHVELQQTQGPRGRGWIYFYYEILKCKNISVTPLCSPLWKSDGYIRLYGYSYSYEYNMTVSLSKCYKHNININITAIPGLETSESVNNNVLHLCASICFLCTSLANSK